MTSPTWFREAEKEIGVTEIKGPRHNTKIMSWASSVGSRVLGIVFNGDETPWCGLFTAECLRRRGLRLPSIAIRAMSWATWGRDLGLKDMYLGSIVVFKRPGGGHVGFCSGYTDTHVRVLGGNQSNSVNHMWLERSRLVAQRWPAESVQKPVLAPRHLRVNGPVSTNEA